MKACQYDGVEATSLDSKGNDENDDLRIFCFVYFNEYVVFFHSFAPDFPRTQRLNMRHPWLE